MTFLKANENRESFFRRIALFYPKLDYRYIMIERAYDDAKDAFREMYRDEGIRYFEHLRCTALILIDWLRVRDHHLIVAALLHDIVEDKESWTIDRVCEEYDIEIARLLEFLSKEDVSLYTSKEERDRVYHERFEYAPRDFFFVKLADRLHNLITGTGTTKEKRERKIVETKRYYLPYAEKHCILIHELEEAIEILEAFDRTT
ncbi:MAG: GTP pyrophosphokinase [Parcubacteria group bacterium Gr01-1014_48]|nr:MAG: GTP pyrophosphokinase [Parcubacteria group bacterium Greene0416_14]TSC74619.1 MAG: GTP pyrophosphokinase [Parcubacteria group bacterium Gr01-1014_48]TSD01582.1 MAG: GTP pyrophosphokinase [Parcubacteria group bacterium Greene1014_15]TSD08370.1 MAG: GTP pyrophosphokinase [Parcubacteria group bacterium Greene0714_4]